MWPFGSLVYPTCPKMSTEKICISDLDVQSTYCFVLDFALLGIIYVVNSNVQLYSQQIQQSAFADCT